MITLGALVLGTMVATNMGATPLQPATIQRVDNNTIKMYVAKDMDINLAHAKGFEVIIDKGGEPIKQTRGVDNIKVPHIKGGTTINIDVQGGYADDYIVISGHKETIKGFTLAY